jgi:DNA-binding NtrC family response regulator
LSSVPPLTGSGLRLAASRGSETPDARSTAVDTPHGAAPDTRILLYVARMPDNALVEHLKSRGWSVLVARSPHEIGRLIKPATVCAGIVDMASFSVRDLPLLESSLRAQQVGWIALANPERLADPAVRRLIRHYCFDYVKIPVANATIDYLVGHAYGIVNLCDTDMPPDTTGVSDEEMVGTCEAMQQLFRTIRRSRTPTRACSSPANRAPARN